MRAFWAFIQNPRSGAVYNIGGSRHSNCSVLEAARAVEERCGRKLDLVMTDDARKGDHIWWISDVRAFRADYPAWTYEYDLPRILDDLVQAAVERDA